ncbi:ATP-binding protein [Ekhidna sp.]|uniref:ATP-binding protein n=1 Tax=Ekhidna sp. TaxID=2608089 RepID=UPI003CCBC444
MTTLAGAAFLYILDDAKKDRVNDLTNTAKVIESYYELSFHQWELSLLSLGNRFVEIKDPQERLDYANRALEVYRNELLAFGLAEPGGQVVTFTGRLVNDSLPNLSMSERTRRSFESALRNGGLTLGECYYFENVSDWILPIRVPIKNKEGEILAVNTSAIDYSTMMEELGRFVEGTQYKVHLINNEFNTTQILYPMDLRNYEGVLGSVDLIYKDLDTLEVKDDAYVTSAIDPVTGNDIICASILIDNVDHSLIISIEKSALIFEVLNRFKFVFIVYILLVLASILLYKYLKRNLEKSILNLRTERANLKSIIESTSDLIGLFDNDKNLIEFNRAFNISAKVTDGLKLYKGMDVLKAIKNSEQVESFNQLFDRALSGEKFQLEIIYPSPKGDLTFKATYNPVYRDDKVVGFTLFSEDITEIRSYQKQLEALNKDLENKVQERTKELKEKNKELKKGYDKLQSTQQQLIRAEKMASLGILSAGIGHEINNPLNFIKHGALALKERLVNIEDYDSYDQYFNAIEEGVRRASQIVSGLSHFSRTGEAMDETCDVHEVLQNSLTLLTNRFRNKEIEIRSYFHAENSVIIGNEGKLHQVFTNIITNAEQAIEASGVIEIITKNEKQTIIVEITDDGIGMTKKEVESMTDPFYTTKEPGEGTGLGLFITQMIIDEHGAELDVKSKKGEGTTFIITLKCK